MSREEKTAKQTSEEEALTQLEILSNNQEIIEHSRREKRWLFIYISLFLAIMALFILITSLIQIEGAPAKREFEKLSNELYQQAIKLKKEEGLDWLLVENTLAKGVRLTLDKSKMPPVPIFPPARANLNPRYQPYLQQFSLFLKRLFIKEYQRRYQKSIQILNSLGYQVVFTVRVEGHTDSTPLAKTAFYRNNIELSAFRAYQVMKLLQKNTQLPPALFSMAAYGGFHPITQDPTDPRNRRVEVYILPALKALPETSK